ncbi:hypothetical protein [Cohnella abietis]|uniref:Deacetylase PdaC domain-containing protein n=1 Tax=Cohnella abietis TaxID=2507935 RepID=A0A3T1D6Q8_9BACL|nr:hypothetical protein [Cohnella abietis]BBI33770.1 hypothetical protein KCTCHS21_31690 [Cohnella abietis]
MRFGVLILLALILSSCGKSDLTPLNSVNSSNNISKQPIETNTTEEKEPIVQGENKLEINQVSYTKNNVNIFYPEIVQFDDSQRKKELNDLLKNEALQAVDYFGGREKGAEININYVAKWTGSQLLSIQYVGLGYAKGAAYPNNILFTTNLDVENGRKIKLKDMFTIDDRFVNLLKAGKYIPYDPTLDVESQAKDEISKISNTDWIAYLTNADEVSDDNELKIFSYFTNDSLGISISVPHVLGDHVEFEINYQDLKDNIVKANGVWNVLLPNTAN